MKTIAYVAPVFSPAVGGGVVYLRLLAEGLVRTGACRQFVIATEAFPGAAQRETQLGGALEILRFYPFRAGRSKKTIGSYLAYALQNIQFLWLPLWVRRKKVDVIMIHGSFLNNPTTLWLALWMGRRANRHVKFVADLRDPKLPIKKVRLLKVFNVVISCSENITQRVLRYGGAEMEVQEIPIPLEMYRPTDDEVEHAKSRFGLQRSKYVFNGSSLSPGKGTMRTLGLVRELRDQGEDVVLVGVGKKRFWSQRLQQAQEEGWFLYLGSLEHKDVIALSAGSWIDVNLSSVDSMPRHSLEALTAGAKILVPTGVPEFQRCCPDNVDSSEDIGQLAKQVVRIATGITPPCSYPVDDHSPERVINLYENVLNAL